MKVLIFFYVKSFRYRYKCHIYIIIQLKNLNVALNKNLSSLHVRQVSSDNYHYGSLYHICDK